MFSLGFSDFRVRTRGQDALLQFPAEQLPEAVRREDEIRARLSRHFDTVAIDPEGRSKSL